MSNDYLSSSCSSSGCSSCNSGCGSVEMDAEGPKPLGKITAILADLGLEVTYAYDDLVFVQHSAFLLQFTDQPNVLKLFTNTDCDPKEANDVACNIVFAFHEGGFIADPSGHYTLIQNNDETLKLEFM